MRYAMFLMCVSGVAWGAGTTPAGMTFIDHGQHDPRMAGYRTPHGFKLELVAEAPVVKQAEGMAFTPEGALLVVTRTGIQRLPFDPTKQQFTQGTVLLEGRFGANIHVRDGWLYVAGRGVVQRWKFDTIADGKNPQAKGERLVSGFAEEPRSPCLTFGLDGWLYLTAGGDATPQEYIGCDKRTVANARCGSVVRCRPDGTGLALFARGNHEMHELVADGRGFFFYFEPTLFRGPTVNGTPLLEGSEGAVRRDPDGLERDTLCPGVCYDDTQLPAYYRRWLYYAAGEAAFVGVGQTVVDPSQVGERSFALLAGPEGFFQPKHILVGPDGAIYVGETNRVWRLSWGGGNVPGDPEPHPAMALRDHNSWAKLRTATVDELLSALASDDGTTREYACGELRQRKEAPAHFLRVAADAEQAVATRRLSVYAAAHMWNADVRDACVKLLHDADPQLRAVAAELLGRFSTAKDTDAVTALEALLADPQKWVRRVTALALGNINAETSLDALVAAFRDDDAYHESPAFASWFRAIERTGKPGLTKLLELSRSGNDAHRDRCVHALTWARRPEAVLMILEVLADPHLSKAQSEALLETYISQMPETPTAPASLGKALAGGKLPPATVVEALWQLGRARQLTATYEGVYLPILEGDDHEAAERIASWMSGAESKALAPLMLQIAQDDQRPASRRRAAYRMLRHGPKENAAPLAKLLERETNPELQRVLLETIRTLDPTTARQVAAPFVTAKDVGLRNEALVTLGTEPAAARALGERFIKENWPREFLPMVVHVLRTQAAKDAEATALLPRVYQAGLRAKDDADAVQIRQLVLRQGDALMGRTLFLDHCATCHTMHGSGTRVGPDLTTWSENGTIPELLTALLDPHKEIKEAYRTYALTTKDKQTTHGLKLAETPAEVRLQTAQGPQNFARATIADMKAVATSLMPTNAARLSTNDFVSLIAFLQSRAAQDTLRGLVTSYRVATKYDPENPPDSDGPATWERRTAALGHQRTAKDEYIAFAVYVPTARKVKLYVEEVEMKTFLVNGTPGWNDFQKVLYLDKGWTDVVLRVPTNARVFMPLSEGIKWHAERPR